MKLTAPVFARRPAFPFPPKEKARAPLCLRRRIVALSMGLFCLFQAPAFAQDLPPALHPYLPLTVNPARVSTPDQLEATVLYRRPEAGGAATHASLARPLLFGGGHWGGIGFQYTDERTREPLSFRRQRLAGALAYSLKLSARQSLSLGFAGGLQTRRLATPPWSVRSVDARLYSASLPADHDRLRFDLSWGILYRGTDRLGQERFHLGLSLTPDTEEPERTGVARTLPNMLLSGGFTVWQNDRLTLMPQILWAYRQTNQWTSVGGKVSYALDGPGTVAKQLELGAYYRTDRSLTLSLSLQAAAYGLGISYSPPANAATEVGPGLGGPEIALRIFPAQVLSGLRGRDAKERKSPKPPQKIDANPRVATRPAAVHFGPQEANEGPKAAATQNPAKPPAQVSINLSSDLPLVLPPDQTLLFASDQTEISPAAVAVLEGVVAVLGQYPFLTVRVIGHTDAQGPEEANIRLSYRRAQQIADFLLERGVAEERVVVEGRGPFNPRVLNTTPENRALNRRVEIKYQPETK